MAVAKDERTRYRNGNRGNVGSCNVIEKTTEGETGFERGGRSAMEDIIARFFEDLVDRISGPMKFRFVLQPLMAIIFAIKDGRKDAREGRAPYFWAIFTDPEHRRDLLRNGWKSVSKIFIIALILDAVYQFIELSMFYPGEAALVALILAIVPYVLLRGPANRETPRK
jgi:hypothetical protein